MSCYRLYQILKFKIFAYFDGFSEEKKSFYHQPLLPFFLHIIFFVVQTTQVSGTLTKIHFFFLFTIFRRFLFYFHTAETPLVTKIPETISQGFEVYL